MSLTANRIESVFAGAVALPLENRAAYLDRECADDFAMRKHVEALLQAHERSSHFLDQPVPGRPEQTVAYVANEKPGTIIAGRYKLLESIGEGGMGTVWVAEQTEPVRRKVALKLIKAGMDSRSVLARFEAERQALALMDHPNIAKVHDGGLTELGRPFFVMEYVKGVPITEYCDAARLSVHDRLQLFTQVCQAVQHAHQKGIIHRDLKPNNILVAPYDDKPVPKIIDFGLAKAMHQSLTERTLHTAHESVLGTPLYMSPEQAQLNNLDVDTRSDIYSLGVLLYELLTGTTPLEKQRFKEAAWDEVRRIIREEEPPRPSTRLSSIATLPALAAGRQTEPMKLTRLMKGELDWIVMKALEKDRSRRYETANGFAADVMRYLSGEAVTAVPPSAGYRFKKFVKRNKGKVTAAGIILGLLLTAIAGTSFGLYRATQSAEAEWLAKVDAETQKEKAIQSAARETEERKKAETAKTEAQAKEAEANAVVAFFENQVFAAARPKGQAGGLGKAVSLRDAIVASLPALGKGFAAQPLVEARLRRTLGITFRYLAEYEQARDQSEQSRALFVRHRGPDHPDTLGSMMALANSYADLNRPAEALKLDEEVLQIRKRVLPKDHTDTLRSMHNLAVSYADLNRPAEALKLREEVLAIQKRVLPKDDPDTLSSMNNLAVSYEDLNRPAEALKMREEVLEIQMRVLPKDDPDTLMSMHNLANSYTALNRPAEALKLREEVLEIRKRVLPRDHPNTLASQTNLAMSYRTLKREEEAKPLLEDSFRRKLQALPAGHQYLYIAAFQLIECYSALGLGEKVPDVAEQYVRNMLEKKQIHPQGAGHFLAKRNQYFQKKGDPTGCRTSAEMWEKLNQPDAGSLYDAACYRAVTAAVQAKTPGADAARLAKEDADKAMAWLTKAIAAGYKDIAHMKKDADLEFLRDREDFKKLIAELEKKN